MTGLEPATSGVTGRRSNQLSYTRMVSPRAGEPAAEPRLIGRRPACVNWRDDAGSGRGQICPARALALFERPGAMG